MTSPIASRGTRGMQTFFVNGRLVKSQLLTTALEEAYSNRMMKGKFPGCVLLVELPRDMVDVNVHPAKTIVKFVGEKRVFDLVYHAVMAALDKREEAERPQPKPASQVQNPRGDFFANMTSQQYRESRKTAEKPAYTPAGARPVSVPQSAPVKPSPAPQWQTRVPPSTRRAAAKRRFPTMCAMKRPRPRRYCQHSSHSLWKSLSILWKTMTTRSSRCRCRRKTPAPS